MNLSSGHLAFVVILEQSILLQTGTRSEWFDTSKGQLQDKSIPSNKNPPAAKCFSEKSTNCEVPFLKIQQLLSVHTAVCGFFDQVLCSWWIFRIST